MNVLLLEDEPLAVEEMRDLLARVAPEITILAALDSIAAGLRWLAAHPSPDLIFLDIHLADGLSFELFRRGAITCPVIFCTAYDAYALQAFQTNGVDYLLKPLTEDALRRSLAKVRSLQAHFTAPTATYDELARVLLQRTPRYRSSFLVAFRTKMLLLAVDQVAAVELVGGVAHLITFEGVRHVLTQSLEDLRRELDPDLFFLCNRQWLVARRAVLEVEPHFNRKLTMRLGVPTPEAILVSREKGPDFLRWLEGRQ